MWHGLQIRASKGGTGEFGFYRDGGSEWTLFSKTHDRDGNMVMNGSGNVISYWVGVWDIIISDIDGTAQPDAYGVGLGAVASVVFSGSASIQVNTIVKGPDAGGGAITTSVGGGYSNSLAASAEVQGTKYYYIGPLNNFTSEDFGGTYLSATFAASTPGAGFCASVTMTVCRDGQGGALVGITIGAGVSAGFNYGPLGILLGGGNSFVLKTW